MKKQDIITRLADIKEMSKSEYQAGLSQLIADLGPASIVEEGKLTYFVQINERVLDPAQKYPKQMLTCHEILTEHAGVGTRLTRAEVLEHIGNHAELLNTRQTPERIYAFYQKRMEDEGWLTREKERVG